MTRGMRWLLVFLAGALFVYGALVAMNDSGMGWVVIVGAALMLLGLILDRRSKRSSRR